MMGEGGACTHETEPLSRPVLPPPGDALTLFIMFQQSNDEMVKHTKRVHFNNLSIYKYKCLFFQKRYALFLYIKSLLTDGCLCSIVL